MLYDVKACVWPPHSFDIVKAADFGAEQVDDDVTRIDDNPVGLGDAL